MWDLIAEEWVPFEDVGSLEVASLLFDESEMEQQLLFVNSAQFSFYLTLVFDETICFVLWGSDDLSTYT